MQLCDLPIELCGRLLCISTDDDDDAVLRTRLRLRRCSRALLVLVHAFAPQLHLSPLLQTTTPSLSVLRAQLPSLMRSAVLDASMRQRRMRVLFATNAAIVVAAQTFIQRQQQQQQESDANNIVTADATVVRRRTRVSVRCRGELTVPLSRAFAIIEEAVGARRADAARMRIIRIAARTTDDGNDLLERDGDALTAFSTRDIETTVYQIADHGGESTVRGMIARPGGAERRVGDWLRRGFAIEIVFWGGGGDFLIERYALAPSAAADGREQDCNACRIVFSNVERVDTVEVPLLNGDPAEDDAAVIKVTRMAAWFLDLLIGIKDAHDDPHADLTSKRFNYVRQGSSTSRLTWQP